MFRSRLLRFQMRQTLGDVFRLLLRVGSAFALAGLRLTDQLLEGGDFGLR